MPESGFLSIADILGWIGNIGFILGAIALMIKRPIQCQLWNILGNVFYVAVAYLTCTPSLIVLSIALAIINILGISNWRRSHIEGVDKNV